MQSKVEVQKCRYDVARLLTLLLMALENEIDNLDNLEWIAMRHCESSALVPALALTGGLSRSPSCSLPTPLLCVDENLFTTADLEDSPDD